MKLNGAVEPHHGARARNGDSIGATKRRDKRCDKTETSASRRIPANTSNDQYFNNNYNNNNTNNNNNNNNNNRYINESNMMAVYKKNSNNIKYDITRNVGVASAQESAQNQRDDAQEVLKIPTTPFSLGDSSRSTGQNEQCDNKRKFLQQRSIAFVLALVAIGAAQAGAGAILLLVALWCFSWRSERMQQTTQSLVLRAQQSLTAAVASTARSRGSIMRASSRSLVLCVLYGIALLPSRALCDEGDNFFGVNSFSMGPETTTPEFDYASRGQKKFGDKCDNTLECGFPGSICDPKKKSCQCTEDLPVTNHIDKCGKEAAVNESCFFNEQCESKYFQTECRDGRCVCRFEMTATWGKDGTVECKGRQDKRGTETYIDPAMIGVLVGMALMFVIICVVLRLFSQARWRENRTIFNTPNPRLMNVSLLRDSKLLHGQERRGSRMSVRAPSRQPSMASLRPHSPNPSLGSRSGSHGSNASATSIRSNRSNSVAPGNIVNSHHERKGSGHHQHHHHQHHQQQHHHQHQHPHQQQHHHQQQEQQQQSLVTNITPNPVAESVTVEIIQPEK